LLKEFVDEDDEDDEEEDDEEEDDDKDEGDIMPLFGLTVDNRL
jgi:hypothetical protein